MSLRRSAQRALVAATLGGLAAGAAGLAACGEPAPPVPDAQLVEAVVALHLLEARAERTGDVRPADRAAALARLGLDTAGVRAALDRLRAEPEAYAALLRAASARLDSLSALAAGLPDAAVARPDSLAAAPPPDTLAPGATPKVRGLVRPGPSPGLPPGPPR